MATTPVCTISATGLSNPGYAACLAYVQSAYQGIYGSDIYIQPDSQDGQYLAILALAISDANAMTQAVYNAFSPATAVGTGLDSVVKVNGIKRKSASYSSVDGLVVGQAGTIILNGVVSDGTYKWSLPATVTIPLSGQIAVTVTCQTIGAVPLGSGAINTAAGNGTITTPTKGWQSFTNTSGASVGAPVETDAALRIRQGLSTELPSQGFLPGIVGQVYQLDGVTAVTPYMNTGDTPDGNGLPGKAICLVVDGGDDTEIATVIANGRPCCSTFGSTQVPITDTFGLTQTISFQRSTAVPITLSVGIQALAGFTAAIQGQIVTALVNYVNAIGKGQNLRVTRLGVPANLGGALASLTYEVVYAYAARGGLPPGATDVVMAFNEYPTITADNVQVTVTS